MDRIDSKMKHNYKLEIDKFNIFINACLASMKERIEK